MSISIKKIHGTKLKVPYDITELNIYKRHNVIYHQNKFHSIIIGKNLYNLVIYNESDYKDVIRLLINNKYENISFDFNHIYQHKLISELLKNFYNMPYIITKSKIKLPTFNFIYKPDLERININYILYMLNQYNRGDNNVCQAWATFNKNTLKFLRNQIVDESIKGEISGKLKICETIDETNKIVFEICHDLSNINGGDYEEVDSIESRYNYHTHPVCSYKKINTELGWPSYDDYLIFVMGYIFDKNPTHFHWICTLEGIYVLTIPEDSVTILKKLKNKNYNELEKKFENYLKKYINVNKSGFNKDKGIIIDDMLINSVDTYLEYVEFAPNFTIDNKNIKLFDIQFFEWEGRLGLLNNERMYFTFYYPKVGGNCIMKQEHIRD